MSKIKYYLNDREIQIIVATLLRIGVIVSVLFVLVGGVVYLYQQQGQQVALGTFRPELNPYTSIRGIVEGLRVLEGLAIVQLGVVLLIFTPIARIVFSIFGFLIEKDWLYVFIGFLILCIISASLYFDVVH